MLIDDAAVPADMRARYDSGEWYVMVSDNPDVPKSLATLMESYAALVHIFREVEVSREDFVLGGVSYMTATGLRVLLSYAALRKSFFPPVFVDALLLSLGMDYDRGGRDVLMMGKAESSGPVLQEFVGGCLSGSIRFVRGGGMN